MIYTIYLHQSSGETQHVYQSESFEEISKLWEQEKALDDDYTSMDEELTLRQRTDEDSEDEMIDCYPILNSQREDVEDEMDYIVYSEDGEHFTELEKFNSLEEAKVFFNEQVVEAKKDVENYFGMLPTDWNDENTPFIALETLDGDGVPYSEIEVWVPTHPHDVKENN
ncbi:hypothetical protein [Synechococcus sp. MVIR-18-1]|uniref:hypothetical protein n=1 Tax=Synechococcus sp. MVIR-18-1 TaxID=1386941 RepID=UPI0016456579|nr:hypothetical protein [Synechococcus sp. MVIR-18-1]QNI75628.1 hypothetical protein SynMVIR181_00628 [Synechococcus sp. MVIR-18-1]